MFQTAPLDQHHDALILIHRQIFQQNIQAKTVPCRCHEITHQVTPQCLSDDRFILLKGQDMVLFVQLVASKGKKASCCSHGGILGMSVSHLDAYIVWLVWVLWDFTFGTTVWCFVLPRTSQIKHPEHRNVVAKNQSTSPVESPKVQATKNIICGFLQKTYINATYVGELLCWYRFFLLQKSVGKASKNLPTQESIYSDGTLFGQRNQLVHLCFSDGDEKHLDRIPREEIVWMLLSQGVFLDLDLPRMRVTQNFVE